MAGVSEGRPASRHLRIELREQVLAEAVKQDDGIRGLRGLKRQGSSQGTRRDLEGRALYDEQPPVGCRSCDAS